MHRIDQHKLLPFLGKLAIITTVKKHFNYYVTDGKYTTPVPNRTGNQVSVKGIKRIFRLLFYSY